MRPCPVSLGTYWSIHRTNQCRINGINAGQHAGHECKNPAFKQENLQEKKYIVRVSIWHSVQESYINAGEQAGKARKKQEKNATEEGGFCII